MPSSRGSSRPRDQNYVSYVSCNGREFFTPSTIGKHPNRLSVQFSSVAQLLPTLCHPMNRSMPGFPVHHQLLDFTQTHVHRVSDAIQPSHPLSSPFFSCLQFSPASGSFLMSWLFASGGQSIGASGTIMKVRFCCWSTEPSLMS